MENASETFREMRRKGIGGTDISAIMCLNPYKTAYEVYLEKVEGYSKDLSSNEAVRRGIIFENPASELYELQTGKKIYSTGMVTHKDYSFLIANPDRVIPSEKRGVEIKTVGRFSQSDWGESGTEMIPEHYYMQIAHYMLVLDYEYWDVAALFPDYELKIYSFERNKNVDEIILEAGESFWKNHVEKRVPPEMDFEHLYAKDLLKARYRSVNEETINLSDDLIELSQQLSHNKEKMKFIKASNDFIESKILEAMGNANVGLLSNGDRFMRKVIQRKEYMVKGGEYIRLDYRPRKEEEDEVA